jgi:hypothetical protein
MTIKSVQPIAGHIHRLITVPVLKNNWGHLLINEDGTVQEDTLIQKFADSEYRVGRLVYKSYAASMGTWQKYFVNAPNDSWRKILVHTTAGYIFNRSKVPSENFLKSYPLTIGVHGATSVHPPIQVSTK